MNKIVNHDAKIASIIHQVSKAINETVIGGFPQGPITYDGLSTDVYSPSCGALRWLTGTFLYLYVRCLYRTVATLLTLDFSRRISRENDFLFILFSIWPDLTFCNYPFRLGQTLLNLTIWSIHNRREIKLRLTHTSNLWGAAPLITSFNVGWF